MAFQLQVSRASEFVCLDADEDLDFEATTKALQLLAHACLKRGIDRALLDLRFTPVPSEPMFSRSQLAALVRVFWEAGCSPRHRLAVLYRSDPFGGIRTFAFIGRIYRRRVRAFNDFERAIYWLGDETEQCDEVQETAGMIRLNQSQDERKKTFGPR